MLAAVFYCCELSIWTQYCREQSRAGAGQCSPQSGEYSNSLSSSGMSPGDRPQRDSHHLSSYNSPTNSLALSISVFVSLYPTFFRQTKTGTDYWDHQSLIMIWNIHQCWSRTRQRTNRPVGWALLTLQTSQKTHKDLSKRWWLGGGNSSAFFCAFYYQDGQILIPLTGSWLWWGNIWTISIKCKEG